MKVDDERTVICDIDMKNYCQKKYQALSNGCPGFRLLISEINDDNEVVYYSNLIWIDKHENIDYEDIGDYDTLVEAINAGVSYANGMLKVNRK